MSDNSEKQSVTISRATAKRLIKDIKELKKEPLTGIYYVHDEQDILKGQAMIIGPEDTPYDGGYYLFKFSFNYNSATFIPNYFNSTYLYNRARYYKGILDYPMIQKQIDYLNDNFLVGESCEAGEECEYLIPKDVYLMIKKMN